MAEALAHIYGGTERVHCPFYFKMGACRQGDACPRIHNKPSVSETVLLKNMYHKPPARGSVATGPTPPGHRGASVIETEEQELQRDFEDFYEDVFAELTKYGPLEMLYVCDNTVEHLAGNVYAHFKSKESAEKAVRGLNGRFFAGRALVAELSPVTDFREASCRMFESSGCDRADRCNFLHVKELGPELSRKYSHPAKLR